MTFPNTPMFLVEVIAIGALLRLGALMMDNVFRCIRELISDLRDLRKKD